MKVEVGREPGGYAYRIELEAEDRPRIRRSTEDSELELVRDRWRVELPGGAGELHPDLHAFALVFILRKFVGKRLELPFAVSKELAEAVQACAGVALRSDASVRPRRAPDEVRPALLFSGGADSVAAAAVLPARTRLLVLDRIVHEESAPPDGHALVDLRETRAVCAHMREQGREVFAVRDDHENLWTPYPVWHDEMSVLAALYQADALGLGFVDTGNVLDVFAFGGYHAGARSWPYRPPRIDEPTLRPHSAGQPPPGDLRALLPLVGLSLVNSISGLSEPATSAIVARSPHRDRAFSCYYHPQEAGAAYCMACDKCFKKLLLRHVADDAEVPAELFERFQRQPHLRGIFQRPFFDWHHVWYYLFQKIRCAHPYVQHLQAQTREGPDLGMLGRFHGPSAKAIPAAYRDETVQRILGYVPPMSAEDLAALETLRVPPLVGPRDEGMPAPPAGRPDELEDDAERARTLRDPEAAAYARTRDRPHWAINTTVRCQNACLYCFEGDRRELRDVPFEDSCRLIDEAAGRVKMVIFMGAESTLNPRFVDLIKHARSRGLVAAVSTNALRFANPQFLAECHEAGLSTIELSFPYTDAAMFAELTRRSPKLYDRLLQALRNIEAVNQRVDDPTKGLSVNANVIVSGLNADRLGEAVSRLVSIFQRTPLAVTFRRVIVEPTLSEETARRVFVPLAKLRGALAAALALVPQRVEIAFRGLPLCAMPGWEHLAGDVWQQMSGYELQCNFTQQDVIRPMGDAEGRFRHHRYEWVCGACALDPWCTDRGQFDYAHGVGGPERAPVPVRGGLPPAIAAMKARAESVGGTPPAHLAFATASDGGRFLDWMWEKLPPGAPFADGAAWQPLETGVVHLARAGEQGRFRVRHGPEGFSLRPEDPLAPPGPALVAAAQAWVDAARHAPVRPPGPVPTVRWNPMAEAPVVPATLRQRAEALVPAVLRSVEEALAADGRPFEPPVCQREGGALHVSLSLPGWPGSRLTLLFDATTRRGSSAGFLGGRLPPEAEPDLRRLFDRLRAAGWAPAERDADLEALLAGATRGLEPPALVAWFGSSAVLRPGGAVLSGGLRLRALPGDADAFVCGGRRLEVERWLLDEPATWRWRDAAVEVCAEAAAAFDPPASPLPGLLWDLAGPLLLPRSGWRARSVGGKVGERSARLSWATPDGTVAELALAEAEGGRLQLLANSFQSKALHEIYDAFCALAALPGGPEPASAAPEQAA